MVLATWYFSSDRTVFSRITETEQALDVPLAIETTSEQAKAGRACLASVLLGPTLLFAPLILLECPVKPGLGANGSRHVAF